MEVKLSAEQSELVQSVRGLLERHRSSARVPGPSEADLASLRRWSGPGYTDIISSGGSAVDAVLVVEDGGARPGCAGAGRAWSARS